ncbi:head GIN domain-containing protein [Sphingomicrobium clamense]|uniref:DUF2807 domain-containing protein n=1 Tax=Sphingomicrobium clamense TaxID=2851013 RepID=A0ABS6V3K9_9SPHN|nr:head GIN domain-containing protein [Sphingomicrobium sp. B8]MBW0144133.1 DUF2807 domain-containing protein [Sphingomicrobium sp. B8]
MKTLHLILAAGAAAGLSGCFGDDRIEIDKPGPTTEETRDVGPFSELGVAGPYRVIVSDGAPSALSISGPENIIEHTKFEVDGDELEIRLDRDYKIGWKRSSDDVVEIRFSHNALEEAGIAGSGSIDIARSEVDDFEGDIAGSGNLTVQSLAARRAEFGIAGSGSMKVSGATENLEVGIAGSGEFISPELESTDAEIEIAGSGEVETRVTGNASVSIAGSGDVAITGGAKCSVSKAGSGNVTCE